MLIFDLHILNEIHHFSGPETAEGGHIEQPEIVDLPSQHMAVVHTIGDPDRVMSLVLPPLCSSVYRLKCERMKLGKDFGLDHFRVRWLDRDEVPRKQWHLVWGLPIPEDATSLPQKFPYVEVEIETWEYGTVAQSTYRGPGFDAGFAHKRALASLKEYATHNGYEITGPLEEEYIVGPEPQFQRTRLRYPVKVQSLILGEMPSYSMALC